jgi:hypothetical protein
MLVWASKSNNSSLLDKAIGYLTIGRAALYQAVFEKGSFKSCHDYLQSAVDALRRAGEQHFLDYGLLTRAWMLSLTGSHYGTDSAQTDLNEAWEIAERGPMRLHMADIHLHRARLFFREKHYPWESPQADLKAARDLIEKCGYWRRKEELEDAEKAILGKPTT